MSTDTNMRSQSRNRRRSGAGRSNYGGNNRNRSRSGGRSQAQAPVRSQEEERRFSVVRAAAPEEQLGGRSELLDQLAAVEDQRRVVGEIKSRIEDFAASVRVLKLADEQGVPMRKERLAEAIGKYKAARAELDVELEKLKAAMLEMARVEKEMAEVKK